MEATSKITAVMVHGHIMLHCHHLKESTKKWVAASAIRKFHSLGGGGGGVSIMEGGVCKCLGEAGVV